MSTKNSGRLEAELESLEWKDSERADREWQDRNAEKVELFDQYDEEGHLCFVGFVGGENRPGRVWAAWCVNCRVSTMGTAEQVWRLARSSRLRRMLFGRYALASWTEAKLWTRRHRAEHGLPKQEIAPCIDVSRVAVGV